MVQALMEEEEDERRREGREWGLRKRERMRRIFRDISNSAVCWREGADDRKRGGGGRLNAEEEGAGGAAVTWKDDDGAGANCNICNRYPVWSGPVCARAAGLAAHLRESLDSKFGRMAFTLLPFCSLLHSTE